MSILDRLEQIKNQVRLIAEQSLKENWISEDDYNNIVNDLEKEKIIIGVVGQMKYGKSTLLNAFIFKKPILPSASTPMTASLTFITYGDEAVVVEFYTHDEWKEIEKLSQENSDSDIVKSAQELVQNSFHIKHELKNLLGKKHKITFQDLNKYVGVGGKYVPITKSITISYPVDILKNVDFVDTPGFNDPIISRELRAKELLSKADVVLVLLFSHRPFDASDKDIIFSKIRNVGLGKVILVVNKWDLLLDEYGTEEKVINYINEKFNQEIVNLQNEDKIISKIFSKSKIIPFSSLLALLGVTNENEIVKDKDGLGWYYSDYSKKFPSLRKQSDFVSLSKLPELEKEIDEIIKNEKLTILVNKPISKILGKMNEIKNLTESKIYSIEMEIKNLDRKKSEIQQELNSFKIAEKEIKGVILTEIFELEKQIIIKKNEFKRYVESQYNQLFKEIPSIIPEKKFYEFPHIYVKKCESIIEIRLIEFKDAIDQEFASRKNEMVLLISRFISDIDVKIEQIAYKNISYSVEDLIKIKKPILDILNEEINFSFEYNIDLPLVSIASIASILLPLLSLLLFNLISNKSEIIKIASEKIENNIPLDNLLQSIESFSQKLMDYSKYIDEKFNELVILPLKNNLEQSEKFSADREMRLKKLLSEKELLTHQLKKIEERKKIYQNELSQLMV